MSYDLDFWKYRPGIYLQHQELYERLLQGTAVEGLQYLPVAEIRSRIATAFADWEQIGDDDWEQVGKGAFRIFTTTQFIRIHCFGMEGSEMNKFVDILYAFECPLYDPQVARRFDGVQ